MRTCQMDNQIFLELISQEDLEQEQEEVFLIEDHAEEVLEDMLCKNRGKICSHDVLDQQVVKGMVSRVEVPLLMEVMQMEDKDQFLTIGVEVLNLLKKYLKDLLEYQSIKTTRRMFIVLLLWISMQSFIHKTRIVPTLLRIWLFFVFSFLVMLGLMERLWLERNQLLNLIFTPRSIETCMRLLKISRKCRKFLLLIMISPVGAQNFSRPIYSGVTPILRTVMEHTKMSLMLKEIKNGKEEDRMKQQEMMQYNLRHLMEMHYEDEKFSDDKEIKENKKNNKKENIFMFAIHETEDELSFIQKVVKIYFIIAVIKFTLEIFLYILQILRIIFPCLAFVINCLLRKKRNFLVRKPLVLCLRKMRKVIVLFTLMTVLVAKVSAEDLVSEYDEQYEKEGKHFITHGKYHPGHQYIIAKNETTNLFNLYMQKMKNPGVNLRLSDFEGRVLFCEIKSTGYTTNCNFNCCIKPTIQYFNCVDTLNLLKLKQNFERTIFRHANQRLHSLINFEAVLDLKKVELFNKLIPILGKPLYGEEKDDYQVLKTILKFLVDDVILEKREVHLLCIDKTAIELKTKKIFDSLKIFEQNDLLFDFLKYYKFAGMFLDGKKHKDLIHRIKNTSFKFISNTTVDVLNLPVIRESKLKTTQGFIRLKNHTVHGCNDVVVYDYKGIMFSNVEKQDPFLHKPKELIFGHGIRLNVMGNFYIQDALEETFNKKYTCIPILLSLKRTSLICIHTQGDKKHIWLDHKSHKVEEIERTSKDHDLYFDRQGYSAELKHFHEISLCATPENFSCGTIDSSYDATGVVVLQKRRCKNMVIKKVTYQDDVRFFELKKYFSYELLLEGFMVIGFLPVFLFVSFKFFKHMYINLMNLWFLVLYLLKRSNHLEFLITNKQQGFFRKIHKRSINRVFSEKGGFRFLLKSWLFPLHCILQFVSVFLIPIMLILLVITRGKFTTLFPLTFWFGSAQAFHNEGILDPCNTDKCNLDKNDLIHIRHLMNVDKLESKLNEHHFCANFRGLKDKNYLTEHFHNAKISGIETIGLDCSDVDCQKKYIYEFTLPLFPCAKAVIRHIDGSTLYFIIEDVNTEISTEVLFFTQAFRVKQAALLLNCGKSYCGKQLSKINHPSCRYECESKDFIDNNVYERVVAVKSPFQHMMLLNDNDGTFQLFNTRFKFHCELHRSDCYDFDMHILSFSDREELYMDYFDIGSNYWMLTVFKIETRKTDLKVDIFSGDSSKNFEFFEDQTKIDDMEFGKIDYKINIEKIDLPKYIIAYFDELIVGKYAKHMFAVDEIESFKNKIPFYCANGYQIKGISDECSYNTASIFQDFDLPREKILKQLRNNFRELTIDNENGFKVEIMKIFDKNVTAIPEDLASEIRSIKNVKAPEKNEVRFKEFIFKLYQHKLNYGSLDVKMEFTSEVENKDNFGSKSQLKINECKGSAGIIAGISINLTRVDDLEKITYFECLFGKLRIPCGLIIIKNEEKDTIAHLTIPQWYSINSEIILKQTFPLLKNEINEIKVDCKIIKTNLTFAQIGSHLRGGQIKNIHVNGFFQNFFQLRKTSIGILNFVADEISSLGFLLNFKFYLYVLVIFVILYLIIQISMCLKIKGYQKLPYY
ncbi:ORF4 [Nidovirales sp.]|nr:ORF4 [Nidovirales sp.]